MLLVSLLRASMSAKHVRVRPSVKSPFDLLISGQTMHLHWPRSRGKARHCGMATLTVNLMWLLLLMELMSVLLLVRMAGSDNTVVHAYRRLDVHGNPHVIRQGLATGRTVHVVTASWGVIFDESLSRVAIFVTHPSRGNGGPGCYETACSDRCRGLWSGNHVVLLEPLACGDVNCALVLLVCKIILNLEVAWSYRNR